MRAFANRKHHTVIEMLFYLLGIFSTMQIITIFDLTVFNILLVIAFLSLLFCSRFYFRKSEKHIFILAVATIFSLMSALFGNILPKEFISSTVMNSAVNILILGVAYMVSSRNDTKLIKAFIKGFYCSCIIQIVWCILQYILYNLGHLDLNKIIFDDLLHMATDTSTYRNGKLVCTGLCWHAATLVPVLLFAYLKTKNWFAKVLYLFIAFESKSATASIAIMICLFFDICFTIKKLLYKRYNKEDGIIFLLATVLLVAVLYLARDRISDNLGSLIKRVKDIVSTEGGNSSAVHFSYYTQLPKIIKEYPIFVSLFGLGVGCSGFAFSDIFNQYVGLVWVVESDYVNIFLSQGLFGLAAYYGIIIYFIRSSRGVSKKNIAYLLIMLLCGITYNVQFNWVLFFELLTFRAIQSSEDIFECSLISSSSQNIKNKEMVQSNA